MVIMKRMIILTAGMMFLCWIVSLDGDFNFETTSEGFVEKLSGPSGWLSLVPTVLRGMHTEFPAKNSKPPVSGNLFRDINLLITVIMRSLLHYELFLLQCYVIYDIFCKKNEEGAFWRVPANG